MRGAETGRCWFLAVLLCAVSGPVLADLVPVRLAAVVESADMSADVTFTLTNVFAPAGPDAPPERIMLRPKDALLVRLSAGSAWRVEVDAGEYWAPPSILTVADTSGNGPQRFVVELFAAGTLEGTVTVPADEELPDELTVRFEPVPGSELSFPQSLERCPLEEGQWSCKLPAGTLDLRLRSKGYISHYRWGEVVPPRDRCSIGTLKLVRGASVVGWLAPPAGNRDFNFADCRARLTPTLAGESGTAIDRERREDLDAQAGFNERGFFELAGVAPGSYRLTVEHPDYAPTELAPVEVFPNAETEIRELELNPFTRLALQVRPALTPRGEPWRVLLLRQGPVPGHLDEAATGTTGSEGGWQSPGLAPGGYLVRIQDARGSRWHTAQVELVASVETHQHEVDLPLRELAGQVLLGDEPLEAYLYFGGYHGVPRINVPTDESGVFRAILPDREEWEVDVFGREPETRTRVDRVAVPEAAGDEPAWVEIVVPDTTLSGRVITVEGKAYVGAAVIASRHGDPGTSARSRGPDGQFSLRGLQEGEWTLEAKAQDAAGTWSSQVEAVQVDEEDEAGDVELVLRQRVAIEGQVISPDGQPVVGAIILGLVEQQALALTHLVPEASTNVDGVFEIAVPGSARGVQLTVMAPGFAIEQLWVDASEPTPVIVTVQPVGGTVVLRFEQEPGGFERVLLFREFLVAGAMYLDRWAQANGVPPNDPRERRLPLMPPGPYTACFNLQDGGAALLTGRTPPTDSEACVQGVLAPYGEVELVLPSPPP